MEGIIKQLKEYNKAYREGKPIVSDSVYDALLDKLPEDHPYRNQVEPEELYKGRIKHNKPMLSMQKAKTEEEMSKWIDSVYKACDELNLISRSEVMFRASAKLDGIAGKYEAAKLVTRGDGQFGNDITDSFDKGLITSFQDKTINLNGPISGELVIKLDYFKEHLSEEFSHPRNFVSGAIMADISSPITEKAFKDNAIVFQAYSDLSTISYSIIELLENFREIEKDISSSVNYPIDGVIFEITNKELKGYMGETSHHPNWAIALKPKDKTYESTIIEIVWQTGRTGKVTPVINIEPTIIDGVEVRRASGHNAKMIETMGIKVGKRVELIRSGSVIPYILGVIEDGS